MNENITEIVPRSPFWGWGDPNFSRKIPAKLWPYLRENFDINPIGNVRLTPHFKDVELPDSHLPGPARDALAAALGTDNVRVDREARIIHAAGKSYVDNYLLHTARAPEAPDAVVYPGSDEDILAIFRIASENGLTVVPFGGGTSVVGGVRMTGRGEEPVIAVSMERFNRLLSIDQASQLATLQTGMRGSEVEAALSQHGYTMGHYPQSHQEATLGGYIATRSAGQASTGYGRSDSLVRGLKMVTPQGIIHLDPHAPSSAAGPNLMQALIGSEGTLGIITEVTVQVVPAPTKKLYASFVFPNFPTAAKAFRELYQQAGPGWVPDVCRLSNEEETRDMLLLAGKVGTPLIKLAALKGMKEPCIAIFVWEGNSARQLRARKALCTRILKKNKGKSFPKAVAKAWEKGRFHGPYLRDALIPNGILAETLETAATWKNLGNTYVNVHNAIFDAAQSLGKNILIQCHISHVYRGGASLYYTFVMEETADPLNAWQRIKDYVGKAINESGATITHHHGVGTAHRPYLKPEIGGDLGVAMLKALKQTFDPAGILNPGKLIPED